MIRSLSGSGATMAASQREDPLFPAHHAVNASARQPSNLFAHPVD